ncbi:hypothetical protein [Brachybacterium sp. UNK5269]|uniref:hypothetical protein n=1 Tax=Brachybacterium sp. UNK5269 TaxID=3408576 RepID=UPI003BAFE221
MDLVWADGLQGLGQCRVRRREARLCDFAGVGDAGDRAADAGLGGDPLSLQRSDAGPVSDGREVDETPASESPGIHQLLGHKSIPTTGIYLNAFATHLRSASAARLPASRQAFVPT